MDNKLRIVIFGLLAAALAFPQATTTQTTLSTAITTPAIPSAGAPPITIVVASATGILAPTFGTSGVQTALMIDNEYMEVMAISGTTLTVRRARRGTQATFHAANSVVWAGNPTRAFLDSQPAGQCTASNQFTLPLIVVSTGAVFDCKTVPTSNSVTVGLWVQTSEIPPYGSTDGYVVLPATACQSSVSGNSAGTNGYTVAGTSNTPVVQASTSAVGTNTHTYVCSLALPTRLTSLKGVSITDVTFLYGVQTTALGTQVATLASGTMNASTVFSSITYPAAAASETASTVAPVRADAGTLVITPVVASFNTGLTTAGAFFSAKFAPATPIPVTTDLVQSLFTVTLQCAATVATVTNSPGILVHYTQLPL